MLDALLVKTPERTNPLWDPSLLETLASGLEGNMSGEGLVKVVKRSLGPIDVEDVDMVMTVVSTTNCLKCDDKLI